MDYGPGGSATFLYYFTSTAIIFAFITARTLGTGLEGVPQQVGLLGGIVGGLLGAYFNRTITLSLEEYLAQLHESAAADTTVKSTSSKKMKQMAIAPDLQKILTAMGYDQTTEPNDDGVAVYTRSGLSRFVSGKIYVHTEEDKTTVASRAIHIRALKKILQSAIADAKT